jgi:atypical dual specificity phosphatase
MNRMTHVWERLWLGGIDDAESLAKANPNGISTVLTLCPERVEHRARAINYLQFPVEDCRRIPAARFDTIIDALWENVQRGKVLVHCAAGLSRSPIITASWMHLVGYENIDEALAAINRIRPIDPSPVLLKSVKELL